MSIHIKTAFDYIKRSPFQAMAAITVLTLTFFVATILAVLVYSSSNVLRYFETRPQVIAFLKSSVTDEQVVGLQNKLTGDGRVKSVKYVPKEEALAIYQKATADNPLLGELVSPSIFPASLEFSVVELAFATDVIGEIEQDEAVESVGFTASLGGESNIDDVITRLKNVTLYVRYGGLAFVGFLGAVSLLVLLVIIGMRLATRKEEIEILNLVGATAGFIRSPIVYEAFIYATAGVVLGWVMAFTIWLYATPAILQYFGEIPVLPAGTTSFFTLFLIILGAELLVGITLALIGSSLALSRALKNR